MRAFALALFALVALVAGPVYANWCAVPGRNGTGTPAGVVNTYYPGTASVGAGATSIAVGAPAGAADAIAAGDLLLVIQMQDATIDTRNNSRYGNGTNGGYGQGYDSIGQTGRYEFVRATGAVSGGSVGIVGATGGGLVYGYNHAAASATGYRRSFQVVRVPQYDQVTISGTVSAMAWNGSTGGVVALDVARRLTFSGGTVSASGLGFRGGGGRALAGGAGANSDYATAATNAANASKGEGIVGTPRYVNNQGALQDIGVEGLPGGSYARGAPGNAGGGGTDGNPAANDQNSGGGGGGNGGDGGLGGHAWCPTGPSGCPQTGGHPATAVAEIGVSRVVMGGGGGAGTSNNATGSPGGGFASSGAAGGGIVIVRAGEIAGTGTVIADGADANSTILNDSNGGGGAGGSVLIAAVRTVLGTSLTASANGGDGGSNTGGGAAHGPGGGGGGGFIASSLTVPTSVAGGSAGATQNGGSFGAQYGAIGGNGGNGIAITGANIPGISSGGECTPTVSKSFATSPIAVGATSRMSITVTNNNPTVALTAAAFTDTYPAGMVNTASPAAAKSCGTAGTLTAAANGGSFAVSAATISAAASCTYSVNTTVTTTGDKTNTLASGAVAGNYGSYGVASLENASAVLQVMAPLTIVKASQAYSDPQNGAANPKLIPGGFLHYTVTVANPTSYAVDNNSVVLIDATPGNLQLFVGNIPSGSGPLLFVNGSPSSGLTYSFVSLASTTDDVDFSNNGGSTWTYVPTPNSESVDPAVTHIRIRPKGSMAAGSSFTLIFSYRIG
jgi:hypothetical protein